MNVTDTPTVYIPVDGIETPFTAYNATLLHPTVCPCGTNVAKGALVFQAASGDIRCSDCAAKEAIR